MSNSEVGQRADRPSNWRSGAPPSQQPRVRFSSGRAPKLPVPPRVLVVGLAVAVIVALGVIATLRNGNESPKGASAASRVLPGNVVTGNAAVIEAGNVVDGGGDVGNLASAQDVERVAKPVLEWVDRIVSPAGDPVAPPTGPPVGARILSPAASLPCVTEARAVRGARVLVYVVGAHYKGTPAVVLAFTDKAPRPVNVFVMSASDCRLLTRTALS